MGGKGSDSEEEEGEEEGGEGGVANPTQHTDQWRAERHAREKFLRSKEVWTRGWGIEKGALKRGLLYGNQYLRVEVSR